MAPVLHVCLFALTWALFWLQSRPLAQGPADWPFRILFPSDFPISTDCLWCGVQVGRTFSLRFGVIGILGTIW